MEPETEPITLVSDPVLSVSAGDAGTGLAAAQAEAEGVVYVSLPPDSIPDGVRAVVRQSRTGITVSTSMMDGGFDPIPMPAGAGDSLTLDIQLSGGGTPVQLRLDVPEYSKPRVVRTYPARKKRDVPLNASLVIVFSEPIDSGTLASSVRLVRGTSAVAGTVRLVYRSGSVAEFIPAVRLDANTEYRLEVADGMRDLDGDRLEAAFSSAFTTGSSLTGSPASIQLSPDSILGLFPGASYDITPTVRDAAGNALTGHAVTWTSSAPETATVAAVDTSGLTFGRVTAVAEGSATIAAATGDISGTAFVTVTPPPPIGVASLTIEPESLSLAVGDVGTLVATLRDASGREIGSPDDISHASYVTLRWQVDNPAAVKIARDSTSLPPYGWTADWNRQWITGRAEGSATLIATSEGVSDTALVTVGPRRAVASVRVSPRRVTTRPESALTLIARLSDVDGTEINWRNGGVRPITWAIGNPAVATIDSVPGSCEDSRWLGCAAVVTVLDTGVVTVTATSEGVSDNAVILVPLLTFVSLSAGGPGNVWGYEWEAHTCGVAATGVAVCWGGDRGLPGDEWSHYSTVPWVVSGETAFASVSAGESHTCGLTSNGDAYCWGSTIYRDDIWDEWRLIGSTDEPQPVSGGHRFVSLDAGTSRTCGLTTAGAAYCWGGWVGAVPTAVPGGLSLAALTVGRDHDCGVTADGTAYCWGSNASGQLGDGSTTGTTIPVPVSGGHSFVALTAGDAHSCGLTAAGAAYCWGSNASGQLGDGSASDRAVPTAVSGGLSFVALSAGAAASTTCGLTGSGAAYCWGENDWGQVGDGTTSDRAVPTPVTGGLSFASLSTAGLHTCGLTEEGGAYCWGSNVAGQLGDGTLSKSAIPVRVLGQP